MEHLNADRGRTAPPGDRTGVTAVVVVWCYGRIIVDIENHRVETENAGGGGEDG